MRMLVNYYCVYVLSVFIQLSPSRKRKYLERDNRRGITFVQVVK